MPSSLSHRVAAITSRPRSLWVRVIAQTAGGALFLIVIPPLLFWMVRRIVPGSMLYGTSASVRIVAGSLLVVLGLTLAIWACATFWLRGRGTAAPIAAPQRLVTSGPYCYCRNPMQSGAALYYFGFGTLFSSVSVGLGMFVVALLLATLYHKLLEERELRLRFGQDYETYCRQTPFLFPRFPRRPE